MFTDESSTRRSWRALAVDSDDTLYLAGFDGVFVLARDDGSLKPLSLEVRYAGDIILDGWGRLLVSDTHGQAIVALDVISGDLTSVGGSNTWDSADDGWSGRLWPTDLAMDASGNLFVVDGSRLSTGEVVRVIWGASDAPPSVALGPRASAE